MSVLWWWPNPLFPFCSVIVPTERRSERKGTIIVRASSIWPGYFWNENGNDFSLGRNDECCVAHVSKDNNREER